MGRDRAGQDGLRMVPNKRCAGGAGAGVAAPGDPVRRPCPGL